jgi:hypothetical protein
VLKGGKIASSLQDTCILIATCNLELAPPRMGLVWLQTSSWFGSRSDFLGPGPQIPASVYGRPRYNAETAVETDELEDQEFCNIASAACTRPRSLLPLQSHRSATKLRSYSKFIYKSSSCSHPQFATLQNFKATHQSTGVSAPCATLTLRRVRVVLNQVLRVPVLLCTRIADHQARCLGLIFRRLYTNDPST